MANTPLALFTLASGRSGTSFLADFFLQNVLDCYSTHEPYLTPGNPTLFGKPIEWNTLGDDAQLLPVLEQKCRFIAARPEPFYFEANHAFLKAFNRHAPAMLDRVFGNNVGFIHLVRNPQSVAKSELLREQVIRRFPIPFVDYRSASGANLFRWSFTGQENIFQALAAIQPLTRFQFYVVQWFEMEYRAMQLLQHNNWQQNVFFIDVERDLRDEAVLKAMLDFFGLSYKPQFTMDLHRNKTWFAGSSVLTPAEQGEFRFVLQHLPEPYRAMLRQPPYSTAAFAHVFTD